MTAEAIRALLPATCRIGREIIVLEETTSTNDEAIRLGREGAVVFAEHQTAGRGRMTRRWESPTGLGLYFSVLLRPAHPQQLTTWAAVAVTRALGGHIKWPNDIFLNGKKVVGILCETTGNNTVVGIGVNVNQTPADFPPELHDRATSLREAGGGSPLDRIAVAATILRQLDALYPFDFPSIVAEAESRSLLMGHPITVHAPTEIYPAVAEALEPDGSLRVRCADGSTRRLTGGEVSIRL